MGPNGLICGASLDLYSLDVRFVSREGRRLFQWNFPWLYLVPPDKCWDSTLIRPRTFPSQQFPVHSAFINHCAIRRFIVSTLPASLSIHLEEKLNLTHFSLNPDKVKAVLTNVLHVGQCQGFKHPNSGTKTCMAMLVFTDTSCARIP
jgi:hypothetical protein